LLYIFAIQSFLSLDWKFQVLASQTVLLWIVSADHDAGRAPECARTTLRARRGGTVTVSLCAAPLGAYPLPCGAPALAARLHAVARRSAHSPLLRAPAEVRPLYCNIDVGASFTTKARSLSLSLSLSPHALAYLRSCASSSRAPKLPRRRHCRWAEPLLALAPLAAEPLQHPNQVTLEP
jgi:hypothetical protein